MMAAMRARRRYLKITLDGEVVEGRADSSFFSSRRRIAFRDLLEVLREGARHPKAAALWMRVKNNSLSWNQIEEVHSLLEKWTDAGKQTLVWLEQAGNRDYYLACGFGRILLPPVSTLELTGLRLELLFFGELLRWAGVQPHLLQMGKYKSAGEIFTREGFSAPSRENLDSILGDFQERLVARIARQRRVEPERVREWIDQGPYTGRRALEKGLVDGLAYEDEVEEELGGGDDPLRPIAPRKVSRREGWLRRRLTPFRPQLAYLVLEGLIKPGKSGRLPGRGAAGADTIRAALERARKAKRVAAVVLRVDSPGGSAPASDLIWREVLLTDREKPVIVSMGSEAASGGYYVAMGARYVYAMPGTLTGSIGALTGKFEVRELARTLHLHTDAVEKGAHSGYGSPFRGFDDEEKERLREMGEQVYSDFRERVAQGRKLDPEEVLQLAEGRVWTGSQAARRGLVDELGGIEEALGRARREAGIAEGRKVRVVSYRERRSLRDLFSLPFVEAARAQLLDWLKWRIG